MHEGLPNANKTKRDAGIGHRPFLRPTSPASAGGGLSRAHSDSSCDAAAAGAAAGLLARGEPGFFAAARLPRFGAARFAVFFAPARFFGAARFAVFFAAPRFAAAFFAGFFATLPAFAAAGFFAVLVTFLAGFFAVFLAAIEILLLVPRVPRRFLPA
jgi:hypothetical protein